jgi:plasmid stabilization system protein ParE
VSIILLSRSAEADLEAIDDRTLEGFGLNQAIKNRQAFEESLWMLAATPTQGHRREDLDPPGRCFRYWAVLRRFLVVYEPMEEGHPRGAHPGWLAVPPTDPCG